MESTWDHDIDNEKENGYIKNSLYMARKYAGIFVRGHYLFREANSSRWKLWALTNIQEYLRAKWGLLSSYFRNRRGFENKGISRIGVHNFCNCLHFWTKIGITLDCFIPFIFHLFVFVSICLLQKICRHTFLGSNNTLFPIP